VTEAGRVPAVTTGDNAAGTPHLAGRVLLAEDNPDNQRLISLYVRRLGAEVTVVQNGAEAVEAAADGGYDLVLMDMQMPVMDGPEAIRFLRDQGYTGPVVALTANAMQSDVDTCMSAGADGFLSKPVDRAKFNDMLACFLAAVQKRPPESTPLVSTLLADEPDLADLVEHFIEKLPDIVDGIAKAAESQSWKELKDRVHDLKSVGGGYGFMPLSEVAAKIDFDLVKGVYDNIGTWVKELYDLQDRILRGAAVDAPVRAVSD
jgi:CheY-like chemotaxis protein/HPt (histidine-containing phosphotransfer) domain-containing protein